MFKNYYIIKVFRINFSRKIFSTYKFKAYMYKSINKDKYELNNIQALHIDHIITYQFENSCFHWSFEHENTFDHADFTNHHCLSHITFSQTILGLLHYYLIYNWLLIYMRQKQNKQVIFFLTTCTYYLIYKFNLFEFVKKVRRWQTNSMIGIFKLNINNFGWRRVDLLKNIVSTKLHHNHTILQDQVYKHCGK